MPKNAFFSLQKFYYNTILIKLVQNIRFVNLIDPPTKVYGLAIGFFYFQNTLALNYLLEQLIVCIAASYSKTREKVHNIQLKFQRN